MDKTAHGMLLVTKTRTSYLFSGDLDDLASSLRAEGCTDKQVNPYEHSRFAVVAGKRRGVIIVYQTGSVVLQGNATEDGRAILHRLCEVYDPADGVDK